MVRLSSTVARLAKLQAQGLSVSEYIAHDRLVEVKDFGTNPGALQARYHVPHDLAVGAPLVVVLHGCTQTAGAYDHGSGWSELADEMGFAVLFPQQQRSNNPNLCFNWFSPVDSKRGSGEALSIRQMIAAMVDRHPIHEGRIFVTGLSAGGAMASIMLATYPEVFAGGAIVACLPYGAASSVPEAFARMRGDGYSSDVNLAHAVLGATQHKGPWPRISVWQGNADQTVAAVNAEKIIAQWQLVHGISTGPSQQDVVEGSRRQRWNDAEGRVVLEAYVVPGMGHGTPLATGGLDGCGASGPFMLEVGINSTRHIARFWGLVDAATNQQATASKPSTALVAEPQLSFHGPIHHLGPLDGVPTGREALPRQAVSRIIENALRQAGLMR